MDHGLTNARAQGDTESDLARFLCNYICDQGKDARSY